MKKEFKLAFMIGIMTASVFTSNVLRAQVTIGGDTPPAKGAILDLNSEAVGGLLFSNVSLSLSNEIPANLIGNPQSGDKAALKGMVVYNTNAELGVGLYVWDGENWKKLEDTLPAWASITGKPVTFPPTTGTSASTAVQGDHDTFLGKITDFSYAAIVAKITNGAVVYTGYCDGGVTNGPAVGSYLMLRNNGTIYAVAFPINTANTLPSYANWTTSTTPVWTKMKPTADDIPALPAGKIDSGTLAVARGGTGAGTAGQNTVFAGSATEAGQAPSFRKLAPADIPTGEIAKTNNSGQSVNFSRSELSIGDNQVRTFLVTNHPYNDAAHTSTAILTIAADGSTGNLKSPGTTSSVKIYGTELSYALTSGNVMFSYSGSNIGTVTLFPLGAAH